MKRKCLLVIAVLTMSSVLWGSETHQSNGMQSAKESVATLPCGAAPTANFSQFEAGLGAVSTYDYAKCIESCDKQYSDCAKGGDAERVKYCSNQHDKCRKACLEHK